ncbi:MAG: hypothetical protein OXC48_02380 [Endozoicomonadaceae bacterium]|nr:hypothetical protein [Endozoicomonadaceae bacterium]
MLEYAVSGFSELPLAEIRQKLNYIQDVFTQETNQKVKGFMVTILRSIPFQPWLQNLHDCEIFIVQTLADLNKIVTKRNPMEETSDMETAKRAKRGLERLQDLKSGKKTLSEITKVVTSGIKALSEPTAARKTVEEYLPKYKLALQGLAIAMNINTAETDLQPVKIQPWQAIDAMVMKMAESAMEDCNTLPKLPEMEGMREWLITNLLSDFPTYYKILFLYEEEALYRFLSSAPVVMQSALGEFMLKIGELNKMLRSINPNCGLTKMRLDSATALTTFIPSEHIPLFEAVSTCTAGIVLPDEIITTALEDNDLAFNCLQTLYLRVNPPKQIDEIVTLKFQNYIPAIKTYYFSRLWYNNEAAMTKEINSALTMLKGQPERKKSGLLTTFRKMIGSKQKDQTSASTAMVSVESLQAITAKMSTKFTSTGVGLVAADQQATCDFPKINDRSSGPIQTKKIMAAVLAEDNATYTRTWGSGPKHGSHAQVTNARVGSIKPNPGKSSTRVKPTAEQKILSGGSLKVTTEAIHALDTAKTPKPKKKTHSTNV